MAEIIEFPDVEQETVTQLAADFAADAAFGDVIVAGRIPSPRPRRFVRVRVTGGDQTLIVDRPTLVIEGYADTDTDAAAVCRRAVAYIVRAGHARRLGFAAVVAPGIDVIGRPQNLPDPLTEQARYTATVTVALRGSRA